MLIFHNQDKSSILNLDWKASTAVEAKWVFHLTANNTIKHRAAASAVGFAVCLYFTFEKKIPRLVAKNIS